MNYYIGIDVSKNFLDVYIRPDGISMRIANAAKGHQSLQKVLEKYPSCLIVMEATGGYERNLKVKLLHKGFDVRILNPQRVREFAKASGKFAKTDAIDCEVLSLFAEKMETTPSYHASEEELFLKDLIQRRRQLTEEIVREKNRLDKSTHSFIKRDIESHLKSLQKHLKKVDGSIVKLIQSVKSLKEKVGILASMPGIGVTTASVLVADLPELGSLDGKKLAALVGVAPMNHDSGGYSAQRHIRGGRPSVRCSLYMAAIVAIRHNTVIKVFYQRLRNQGKPAKVAIVAAMRKMVIILNQMLTHKTFWKDVNSAENGS